MNITVAEKWRKEVEKFLGELSEFYLKGSPEKVYGKRGVGRVFYIVGAFTERRSCRFYDGPRRTKRQIQDQNV